MRQPQGVEAAGRLRRLAGPEVHRPLVSGAGWVPPPPGSEAPDGDERLEPIAAQGSPQTEGLDRRIVPGTPRRAAVLALALALAVVIGVGARVLLSDAGRPVPSAASSSRTVPSGAAAPSPLPAGAAAGRAVVAASGPSGSPSGGTVVVDVVGKVRRPGVVRLPSGSRVADAVAAAGGVVAGAAVQRVNLARRLVDGEQVLVPGPHDTVALPGAPADSDGGATTGTADAAGAPVDLNSATVAQLDALPGVGPVTAQRIVAWRTQHQRFSRVQELGEVDGIGPKLLGRLTPLVRV